jgi:hypothetical protein
MKTKLCKPILIDDEENIYKDELSLFDDKLIINSKLKSSSDTKQIILISLDKNDEIKSGDLITNGNIIIVAPDIDGFIGFRKVIATQDQLPPEYIQQFIEEYNNGKIEDIEIEIEELLTKVYDNIGGHPGGHWEENGFKPLLTNGFITIIKYPIGGYAPGNYTCNCITCKKQFIGDKRAVQCKDCAIEIERSIIINKVESILYTEKEVKELCGLAMIFGCGKKEYSYKLIDEWFNQNKKK